jgi:DNA end-binding protein Ku
VPPRKRAPRREKAESAPPEVENSSVRGFWSGNLSFGLVSIPVSLITAQRQSRVALRMLSPDGTPLRRRFFCPKEDVALEAVDIVRGYEVEKDLFVVVSDDELKAIAPKLSQEIDLRRFVPLDDIDPMYFEHGYFLVPGKRSGKAYRLLARIMEERGRAGIATFVMRGKQYLVAITARGGLLRAETLRFADELRTTADVGLGKASVPGAEAVNEFAQRIEALRADALDANELEDQQTQRLVTLIEVKRRAGKDVVAAPPEPEEPEAGGAEIVDLMKYLKDSITGKAANVASSKGKAPQAAKRKNTKARSKPSAATRRRTST